MLQKKKQTWVTVIVTVNANGLDKCRLMLINKSKYPIAFLNANINANNLPLTYPYNHNAWMLLKL